MLKIWGRLNSTNVKKVVWAARELSLPYEHANAGGPFGLVNEPEYRALNPNGLVPCVEDQGLILWESNAVVRYLAARHGAGTLWPENPAVRAIGDKWMDWTSTSFAAPFRDVFWNLIRLDPEKRDMGAVEAGIVACADLLARADAALADHPYLSGDAFAMGDIPLGCFAYGWFEMPITRPPMPHLEAWYVRLKDRPAYRDAVMTPLT
ncbi:glutathione S-transferase [Roseixanthobacter pseudopolyaromaticivorans]|uniref:glutathione S-transferase n=1 Tax=Xanthobacteraceae TaxID=335928 RepID=UPI00372C173B